MSLTHWDSTLELETLSRTDSALKLPVRKREFSIVLLNLPDALVTVQAIDSVACDLKATRQPVCPAIRRRSMWEPPTLGTEPTKRPNEFESTTLPTKASVTNNNSML